MAYRRCRQADRQAVSKRCSTPRGRAALALTIVAALATAAVGDDARPPPPLPVATAAPIAASTIAIDAVPAPAILDRLTGHQVRVVAGRVIIDDIAGEGRPWVGVIERRGRELWLRTDVIALRLVGSLARPRIAGPGYLAWATGTIEDSPTPTLRLRRLGILARPAAPATRPISAPAR